MTGAVSSFFSDARALMSTLDVVATMVNAVQSDRTTPSHVYYAIDTVDKHFADSETKTALGWRYGERFGAWQRFRPSIDDNLVSLARALDPKVRFGAKADGVTNPHSVLHQRTAHVSQTTDAEP